MTSASFRLDKVQQQAKQQIVLLDDDIVRHTEYLSRLKAEMSEFQDQLERLDVQERAHDEIMRGTQRAKQVRREMGVAQLKARFAQEIKDLAGSHQKTIEDLHRKLGDELKIVQSDADNEITHQCLEIEKDIEKLRNQMERHTEPEIEEVEESTFADRKIQELRSRKNEIERELCSGLQLLQRNLSQSVETLEDMERNHHLRVENLAGRLKTIDENYERAVERENQRNERVISALGRKLADLQSKYHTAQKTLKSMQGQQHQQLEQLQSETELLRTQIDEPFVPSLPVEAETEGDLAEIQTLYQQRLRELEYERQANVAFHREINKLRFEENLRVRRQSIGLP